MESIKLGATVHTGYENSIIIPSNRNKIKRTITMLKNPKLEESQYYSEFMKQKKTIEKIKTINQLILPNEIQFSKKPKNLLD
jgi:hypothetical protein